MNSVKISLEAIPVNVSAVNYTTEVVSLEVDDIAFCVGDVSDIKGVRVFFDSNFGQVTWESIVNKPDGKLFGGIVTPSSSAPENPTQDVYFIAYESGYYPSFGLDLPTGKQAFIFYDPVIRDWIYHFEQKGGGGIIIETLDWIEF